ncbi:hypothetical protein NPIL_504901 [Nephila pilipes]|uniref:Uncharacterized protein n=1 Tax=Nephila pilipes TaxID=299642 RepID=A0A8X6UJE9_NEPPI|nr:hypothetical protein NPIL_410641 [Nephila pilipes]GFU42330.1 hypothetical protein NPIL_504901 [Nephila pilipes]
MSLSKDRPRDLEDTFDIVCETSRSEDRKLSLDTVKKWFRQSEVACLATGISDKDVANAFAKVSSNQKSVDFNELKTMVENLAKSRKSDPKELLELLALTIPPAVQQAIDSAREVKEL